MRFTSLFFDLLKKKTIFILKTKVLISTIKNKIFKSNLVYILGQINVTNVIVCLDLI